MYSSTDTGKTPVNQYPRADHSCIVIIGSSIITQSLIINPEIDKILHSNRSYRLQV